jgi:hypothetical protein
MLVAAPRQLPILMVGEFGSGDIPTAFGQFSASRSPGQSERTRGAHRACNGERRGERQHVSPAKGHGPGEEGR